MMRLLAVEVLKLKRSLALVFVFVAPALVAVFTMMNALRTGDARSWSAWLTGSSFMWAVFLLPMSVTALAALLAQMEHVPRTWDYLRALPTQRWHVFAAKALLLVAMAWLMSVLVPLYTSLALLLADALSEATVMTGSLDLWAFLLTALKLGIAAMVVITIQFWTALRFASFVPSLAVGIAGTFFAVAAYGAPEGRFYPWLMPVNVLANDATANTTALLLGGGVGAFLMVIAVLHLSRRERLG
jgi:ABC-2 type transport system permease protein